MDVEAMKRALFETGRLQKDMKERPSMDAGSKYAQVNRPIAVPPRQDHGLSLVELDQFVRGLRVESAQEAHAAGWNAGYRSAAEDAERQRLQQVREWMTTALAVASQAALETQDALSGDRVTRAELRNGYVDLAQRLDKLAREIADGNVNVSF